MTTGRAAGGDALMEARPAVVLASDVVGYSRLMAADPQDTVQELEAVRAVLSAHAQAHGGRIAVIAGDAAIAIFDTAAGALLAAHAAQADLAARAAARPEPRRMLLRMGVHVGEVIEQEGGDIYGDTVNIAARLESVAPAGGVAVSAEAAMLARGQGGIGFHDQGEYDAKNISRPLRVFLLDREGGPTSAADSVKVSRRTAKGNLPERQGELVGRAQILRDLAAVLEQSRLVTLFGMGGMGKTRTAIEAARRSAPDFPDGAWFADLAAVDDPDAVAHAVAGVFNVTQQAGRTIEQALAEGLKGQRLLLILDNCEHVTEAAAKLADALLSACPSVKILATSREALSIEGETVWPLPPLDAAGAKAPAAELFAQRAAAVAPGFDAALHGPRIAEICQALDGIPLAIELAAARCRSLAPAQILERLPQRFRLLTGGSRAVRARHQTLLHMVRWSYDLLSPAERQVMSRATVFAGGFTLEAAEAVCAGGDVDALDVMDLVDSLVRKSLLSVADTPAGPRYGMLETIRAFGAERLEVDPLEDRAARRAHARFFADEADIQFAAWRSPRQAEAHAWLGAEINNLRSAFRWARDEGEVDAAARIASSVGDMARFRLVEEAANWAEEIVDQARAARHPRLIILLTWCASTAWAFQRFEDAQRFGEEALSLLDDAHFTPFVWAYGDLAFVAVFSGDADRAVALLAEGAAHPADAHDRFIMAFHLYMLALVGRVEEARALAADVLRKVDAAGVPMSMAVARGGEGAALEPADEAAALAAYESGVEIARASGARFMETLIAPRIAALHARSGEPAEALRAFERMLQSFGEATDTASVSAWRAALIVLFAKLGLYQSAATVHGSLAGMIEPGGESPEHAAALATVRTRLGDRVFDAVAARGAEMSLREGTNYALVQVQLALATLESGMAV